MPNETPQFNPAVDHSPGVSPATNAGSGNGQRVTSIQPPSCHEPSPNTAFINYQNQLPQTPAQGSVGYPSQPNASYPDTRNINPYPPAQHPYYPAAPNLPTPPPRRHHHHHRPSRPSHLRSPITARRWLIRINAIQRPEPHANVPPAAVVNGAPHTGSPHGISPSSTSQSAHSQAPGHQSAAATPQPGHQQDDQRVQQGLVRGFHVLWNRGS